MSSSSSSSTSSVAAARRRPAQPPPPPLQPALPSLRVVATQLASSAASAAAQAASAAATAASNYAAGQQQQPLQPSPRIDPAIAAAAGYADFPPPSPTSPTAALAAAAEAVALATESFASYAAPVSKWAFFIWSPVRRILLSLYILANAFLSSSRTQKSALSAVVFGVLIAALFLISAATYALFYWLYMPRVTLLVPMYLQYAVASSASLPELHAGAATMPWAEVDFSTLVDPTSTPEPGLKPEQLYNFGVQFWVPDSDPNFSAGNFMITMELWSDNNKTLATSHRPAILKYKSPLLRQLATVYRFLTLIWGYGYEDQIVHVPIIDNYAVTHEDPVRRAVVRVSAPKLQVYASHLTVQAHFRGLRYFMYHWHVTTAGLFISFFMFWYATLGLIAWRLLLAWVRGERAAAEAAAAAAAAAERSGDEDDDETGDESGDDDNEDEDDGTDLGSVDFAGLAESDPAAPTARRRRRRRARAALTADALRPPAPTPASAVWAAPASAGGRLHVVNADVSDDDDGGDGAGSGTGSSAAVVPQQ